MVKKTYDRRSRKIRMTTGDLLTRLLCRVICALCLLVFVIPIGYVVISSLYGSNGWSLDGYRLLMRNELVLTGLKNSVLLSLIGTVYSLALEIPAAYVLSKHEYGWLTNLFYGLGQFGVALLPLYLLLKNLGLLNSIWGLILPSGMSIFYTQQIRARMLTLAREMEEAASLDGCGPLHYLLWICIPSIGPTIGVFAFFHVCSYWGNTLLAKTILTDESKYPLTLVLNQILIQNQSSGVLGAGTSASSLAAIQMAEFGLSVISTIPLLIFFLFIKRHIKAMETSDGIVM